MNSQNFGTFVGRLVKDPVYFENRDGSYMVVLNVACRRNFPTGKEKTYESDFIEFRGYIAKGIANKGIYGYLSTGDKIGIQYALRSSVSEKGKERVYHQSAFIESIDILEGRTVREQRRASKESA